MAYVDIKKIYDKERLDVFSMAITHLMIIGWNTAQKITDKQIKEVEGNGIMTQDFCQYLVTLAREISQSCEPSELVQLCQAEGVFDVTYSAGKVNRDRLEKALCNAINEQLEYGKTNLKEISDVYDLDLEELEMLGYEIDWDSIEEEWT